MATVGPLYPTDRTDGTTNDTTLTMDNIYDHREAKLQVGKCITTIAGNIITTYKNDGATTVAHKLAIGDEVIFTSFTTATGLTTSTTGGTITPYYVKTIPDTDGVTFTVSDTITAGVPGTVVTITGAYAGTYLSYNGIIDGAERFGVTEVLGDLMGMTYAGTGTTEAACHNQTIPATSAVAGDSVLAQLMSEITQLYDALVPVRVPVSCSEASGVFTKAAHGIANGSSITINDRTGDTGLSLSAGIYTVSVLTVNTFALTVIATGALYSSTNATSGATIKYFLPLNKAEQQYLTNLKSLKFYRVQDLALTLAFELKRLNDEVANVANKGVLPDSRYPSGAETWNY